ncbi:metallophosphoesterase family protein [Anaeromyxobacter paludicola]|uniref:Calcineurin-like phosphoesterase domain-containing protein n=1 Tax=Anaeromyxobacter paludicola TaxID=2918171 RepID=A0ABN6N802_9BACT|nr:metallophosphoesterase [Anaeromyxobacter paludicola]BDG09323.1 hypothetical protein AMPC_24360 [Anaeromyxobacter paludicola]
MPTLAHLSDLHLGRDEATGAAARRLARALLAAGVDRLLLTGDLTHRGQRGELHEFEEVFAPWRDAGRLTLVPGNHDRLGHDLGGALMPGDRVQVEEHEGLHLVRLDSTGPHNRSFLSGHGALAPGDLDLVDRALAAARPGALRVLMLHHHPLPLPEDCLVERLSSWLGRPWTAELALGPALLARIAGRCDLVLHGHRHAASRVELEGAAGAPLAVLNAGCSTELEAARLLDYADGRVAGERWLHSDAGVAPILAPRPAARAPRPVDPGLAA